jgi:AcrR family transcriptional regulator
LTWAIERCRTLPASARIANVTTLSRALPSQQLRGEEARDRILGAALELFAASGFNGASTRSLAER